MRILLNDLAGSSAAFLNARRVSLPSSSLTFTPATVINSSIQDYNTAGGALTSLVKSGGARL